MRWLTSPRVVPDGAAPDVWSGRVPEAGDYSIETRGSEQVRRNLGARLAGARRHPPAAVGGAGQDARATIYGVGASSADCSTSSSATLGLARKENYRSVGIEALYDHGMTDQGKNQQYQCVGCDGGNLTGRERRGGYHRNYGRRSAGSHVGRGLGGGRCRRVRFFVPAASRIYQGHAVA